MKTYYYNTTANNPNNITLGYLTEYGDFVGPSKEERYEALKNSEGLAVKIIVEGGILAAMPFDDYCRLVARKVNADLKITDCPDV